MMLKLTILLTVAIVLVTTASSSPGGAIQPFLPREETQPSDKNNNDENNEDDVCGKDQKRCFWGCIDENLQCCFDINRDEPWTCPKDNTCGGPPKFGCYGPAVQPTTPSPPPTPPMTLRPTPTSVLRPGGPNFNPTFTITSLLDPPMTTSQSDMNANPPASTSTASLSGALSTRETCLFGVDWPDAAADLLGGCPPALTSVTDQIGTGLAMKVPLLGVCALTAGVIALNIPDLLAIWMSI